MSKVLNMVGGSGGGGADSFMDLIGATEKVEVTYTPTSDVSTFFVPNTSGKRYKGCIIDSVEHSVTSGYTRYLDCLTAQLDPSRDYTQSVFTGKITASNAYEYIAGSWTSEVYLTNAISNGVFVNFNNKCFLKAGKTYKITVFL